MVLLHITAIIVTGLAVLFADEQGIAWMLGKVRTLPHRRVELVHILVSVGLSTVIATGGLLFIRSTSYYLHDAVFLIKMVFVSALIVNGFFIDRLSIAATERPFAQLSARERLPLLISGGVSVFGWLGAGLCGLILS